VLLSATLSALTAPSHHRLGPIHLTADLAVALPPAFPRVAPTTLDFGHLTGTGATGVPVTITGSELGATQVCLKSSSISLPGRQEASNAITTGQRCVQIPANESRKLVLTMSPTSAADGVARGSVVLALRSSDGRTIQTSLPATLEMSRAIDKGKRWEIVALLLVAAILIPLLLLIGSNYWLLGRFSMASGTRTARRPVLVGPSGLRSVDGVPLLLDTSELRNVAISGIQRAARIPVPNAPVSLTARRVLSLRAPEGIAISTTRSRIVSGTAPHLFTPRYEAPVSLGRLDAVFVTFSPGQATDDEARAELFVVIPPGIDLSDAQARIDSLSRRVDWGTLLKEEAENSDAAAAPEDSAHSPATGIVTEIDRSADPADKPPHPPSWLDETESSSQTRTAQHQGRGRRKAQSGPPPAAPTTPSSAPTDVDRPPLPDFLRDED
jgi:hypothetical protein